jgi:hypothetical protein
MNILPTPLQRLLDTLTDRLCKAYDEHRGKIGCGSKTA